jgi:hypothetical protein
MASTDVAAEVLNSPPRMGSLASCAETLSQLIIAMRHVRHVLIIIVYLFLLLSLLEMIYLVLACKSNKKSEEQARLHVFSAFRYSEITNYGW